MPLPLTLAAWPYYPQALPIDDVIMPRIEAGQWRPYPAHSHENQEHGSHPLYATSQEARQRFQAGLLHQLPQVSEWWRC